MTDQPTVVWTEIPVTDLDRATQFYTAVLGWKTSRDDTGPNPMVNFSNDMNGIHGHLYPGTPAANGQGPTIHMAVPGTLAAARAIGDSGRHLVVPEANAPGAAMMTRCEVIAAPDLLTLCAHLNGRKALAPCAATVPRASVHYPDLADVVGQQLSLIVRGAIVSAVQRIQFVEDLDQLVAGQRIAAPRCTGSDRAHEVKSGVVPVARCVGCPTDKIKIRLGTVRAAGFKR